MLFCAISFFRLEDTISARSWLLTDAADFPVVPLVPPAPEVPEISSPFFSLAVIFYSLLLFMIEQLYSK